MGADAPRPALAVVQPRRLVELRVCDAARAASPPARSMPPPARRPRSRPRVDWGRYRLEVSAADGSGLISSVVFNAGYWADEAADSPEMLDVALDKPSYQAGETARVKITSRMAGRALIAVMSSRARQHAGGRSAGRRRRGADPRQRRLEPRRLHHRHALPAHGREGQAHAVAARSGLRWLAVDQTPRTLNVGLDVPEKVKSGATLDRARQGRRPCRRRGGARSRSPPPTSASSISRASRRRSPQDWFFGQRRLGTEIRDLYGRLIDGMRAERGRLRSGGDGSAGGMAVQGNPPVEATLALFSGIVKVGSRRHRARSNSSCPTSTALCASPQWPGAPTRWARRPRM